MEAVLARIALRYLAGALIARGLLGIDDVNTLLTDPDVAALIEIAMGAAIAAATEGFYALARRFGWST